MLTLAKASITSIIVDDDEIAQVYNTESDEKKVLRFAMMLEDKFGFFRRIHAHENF